jgi:hypothetical protein
VKLTQDQYGQLSTALSRAQAHHALMETAIEEARSILGPDYVDYFWDAIWENRSMGELLRYSKIELEPIEAA